MYYPKLYYKLNYIKFFFQNKKNQTYWHYKYILDSLKNHISKALNQVKSFIILEYYKNYF